MQPTPKQNLLSRYKDKAINTLTRPFSKTVPLYNDPNWKNPDPAPKKKGLLARAGSKLLDNTVRGMESLKGGH
jgi:hypothetical protein